jgi:phage terminase large subunit
MSKEVQVKPTKVFFWNKQAYDSGYSLIINQGASSSSKTYSILQLLITIAASTKTDIQICAPSYNRLSRGAMKDFKRIMQDDWKIWNRGKWNETKSTFSFANGSVIEFFPLDDANVAKGPRRDICYINEGNLIALSVYEQLMMRTNKCMFIDFNPSDNSCYLYTLADKAKMYVSREGIEINDNGEPDICFIKSVYKDNDYIEPKTKKYLEGLQVDNPQLYRIYALGERGLISNAIYTNYCTVADLPKDEDGEILGEVWYGADFNFSAAPAALVRVVKYDNTIYLDEMLYEPIEDLERLAKAYRRVGLTNYDLIYGDSAQPVFLREMEKHGFNIRPAKKGQGSVNVGISFIQGVKLHVTARSKNILNGLQSYQWKLDANDQPTNEPDKKKFDFHIGDAFRYALFTKLGLKKRNISKLLELNGIK